jgi:ribosomal protein S18 acetylase RimI-like enzyme
VIRRAARADAAGIALVHVHAWNHNYDGIVAGEHLAARTVEARMEKWLEWLDDPAVLVWVDEVEGEIAGFAAVTGRELRGLYVDPAAQGAGVGSRLLSEAEGAGACELEVFAANGHARGFYEARGWRDDGDAGEWLDLRVRRYVRYPRDRSRDTGGRP